MLHLYINDQLADLADDTPIALTFQINNLAEVKNQQGSTSNQFKLPLTQHNRRILGFVDDVAFNTGAMYNRYTAKIVQDGLEIVPYGIAEVNSADQDSISITVLSGNVDFFDALGGKIYDMGDSKSQWSNYGKTLPWKPYDHVWNLESVASSQKKTEGWIYPVVDYGLFTDDFTKEIDVRYMRPGFFVKTAVELLVRSTGYTADGSLLQDPMYEKLICQFSNGKWEHGTDYQNQPTSLGINVAISKTLQVSHIPIYDNKGTINFDVVNGNNNQFSNNNTFTAVEPMNVIATLNIPSLLFKGKVAGKTPSYLLFFIRVFRGATDQIATEMRFDFTQGFTREEGTSGGNLRGSYETKNASLSAEIELAPGDKIRIDYEFFGDRPSFFTLAAGAALTIKLQQQTVQFGQTVQCERILPDLTQKDFLKDTLQRFGIICQTNATERKVTFASLRDIVNNIPAAKNWSAKCVDQGKSISFQLGNYAQVNTMQFADDDAIEAKFGWDEIKIADTSLPSSAEMLKSPFAPTINRFYTGGTVAQIKMVEAEGDNKDFSIGVSPRLLVNEQRYISDRTPVTFTDGSKNITIKNDYISTPYFYKEDGQHNLCFCDMPGAAGTQPGLRSKYYPELEKILQQTKKVVRYFILTPRDIKELDLLIPVYLEQDGAYYYINKIDAWRKGQPVKIELVRL